MKDQLSAAQKITPTILVIDDERLIRMTLSAKLKLIGYKAVCVSSTQEAVTLLKAGGYKDFAAIITDIMMGDMDGFVFRDILRGMDQTMPIFFITALDPEEGSGFLKRILEDSYSFYLPKAIKTETLLKRVQSIVTSRQIDQFIKERTKESERALELAAHVQHNMLPSRIKITKDDFYTTWWHPKDVVSGDLFEVMPLKEGGNLYVLGDIKGHGTNAALAMMAVQSFLKQLPFSENLSQSSPAHIANRICNFFSTNLGANSYMTALICKHRPQERIVEWISCGAPDLNVIDPMNPNLGDINPEKRGGTPIGMLQKTVYTDDDVVTTHLSETALCLAFTDGLYDIYKDVECQHQLPEKLLMDLQRDLLSEARLKGSIIAAPYKLLVACEAYGYSVLEDDVTELIFGSRLESDGMLVKSVPINAKAIDQIGQEIEQWCVAQNYDVELGTRIRLVYDEKLMNIHDHGFEISNRNREQACIRLRKTNDCLELTVWDCGTEEPSIQMATGDLDVEFELKNRAFSGHGRGRLILRDICSGIQRNRFGILNETIYSIPLNGKK